MLEKISKKIDDILLLPIEKEVLFVSLACAAIAIIALLCRRSDAKLKANIQKKIIDPKTQLTLDKTAAMPTRIDGFNHPTSLQAKPWWL